MTVRPIQLVYVFAPLEAHFVADSAALFFVSKIHWFTFFSRICSGRYPAFRTVAWNSLISNFEP